MHPSPLAVATAPVAASDISHLLDDRPRPTLIHRTTHRIALALLLWSVRRSIVDPRDHQRRHRNRAAQLQREHHALSLEPYLAHRH
ncbi:hypothetical protein [Microbacterium sp. C7(2022)]|uniref:hypothetical protein n=1 Tax=Microbacterium sp. C7(2022) TaxID=2992759 RepID=UPI00237A7D57|nr:hypothetical protein [Microbacterium sp. C7(2022)]MDE0546882.1 hypothetical protein [Microbacterium sp. C7(2022)]